MIIRLNGDTSTIIDDDDFIRTSSFHWGIWGKYKYVATRVNGVCIYLHRFIMNAPDGMHVDHINGDRLDNRKTNLRIATAQQNAMNQHRVVKSNSGYKGVSFRSDTGKYSAHITFNYKKINLGCYDNPITAAMVYDEAARKYFGEFANTNFQS